MKARRIALLVVLFGLGCALGTYLYPTLVRWMISPLNSSLVVNDLSEVLRSRLNFALLCGLLLSATCLCTLISRPENVILTTIVYFTMGAAVTIFCAYYCLNNIKSIAYDFQLMSNTNGVRSIINTGNLPLLRIPFSGICTIVVISLIHRFFWPRKGWEPFTD